MLETESAAARARTVTYTEPYRIYVHICIYTTTKFLNKFFFYSFSLCVKRNAGELARPKSES